MRRIGNWTVSRSRPAVVLLTTFALTLGIGFLFDTTASVADDESI